MKGEVVSFRTSDGLKLWGLYSPAARRTDRCIVYIHGLGGSLFGQLTAVVGEHAMRAGWNFLAFNNRGSGTIIGLNNRRGKWVSVGAALERFADTTKDVRGALKFLQARGNRRFVLAGHSTGCQKSIYYQSKTHDKRVEALVLLGPVSDRDSSIKQMGRKKWTRTLALAKRMVKAGRGTGLMPGGELSARRFWELHNQRSVEGNIFDYAGGKLTLLSRIRVPILAIYGSRDQHTAYGHAKELAMLARNNPCVLTALVNGARHGFEKHEVKAAKLVLSWLNNVI